LIISGIVAYNITPKEIFPPISTKKIGISGYYTNGSIDNINKSIVSPIEDELKNIGGISNLESSIQNGSFSIIVSLDSNEDVLKKINEIKYAIDINKRYFPKNFNTPSVKEISFSFPVGFVSVYKGNQDEMLEVAKQIKKEISKLSNISNVSIYGDKEKIINITLKHKNIEALRLNKNLIINSINQLYGLSQIGRLKNIDKNLFISLKEIKNLDSIRDSLLKIEGKYIYFRDIANISFGYSDTKSIASYNTHSSINISISKNKHGDAINIRENILSIVDKFEMKYKDLSFDYFLDSTVYIINRLNTVISNIIFGIFLVGISMYFLINKRIALIVTIGIPTSFVIGLIFLNLSGYSINMVTLLGALMILGVIVDDAVIIAENIQRHIEEGYEIKEAIINGSKEVFAPVLTASLTTMLSFLPMLLLSGELGEFIKMIPVAISVLIIASLIECFIFLPIHSMHILDKSDKEFNWEPLKQKYKKFIFLLVSHRYKSFFAIVIFVPLITVFAFSFLKYSLFPSFDSDQLYIRGSYDVNYSKEDVAIRVLEIEKELDKKRHLWSIKSISSSSGLKVNSRGEVEFREYFFDITIALNPRVPQNFIESYITPNLSFHYSDTNRIREMSSKEIISKTKKLMEKFKNKNGMHTIIVEGDKAGLIKNDIEIEFFHEDKKKLEDSLMLIKKEIKKNKGIVSLQDDIKYGVSEIKLSINQYGKQIGVSKQDIISSLSPFYLDYEVALSSNEDGILKVISKDINKNNFENFKYFQIQTNKGFVSLKDICDFEIIKNYEKIYKVYGSVVKGIFVNLDKDIITPREVLANINPLLEKLKKEDIKIAIKGEDEKNKQLMEELSMSFALAIFCIFITLLILFNSFRYSLLILSIIPLSFFGGIFGHILIGMKMSMPSFIGLVGLAGVVVNDAIIMLSFLKNVDNIEDLITKASLRLRPILITSITTFLGLSTLIFFATGQAKILQPIAVSLGFGLIWGTILTLIWLPLLFSIVKKIDR